MKARAGTTSMVLLGTSLAAVAVVLGLASTGAGAVRSSVAQRAAMDDCSTAAADASSTSSTASVTGAYASTLSQVEAWDEARTDQTGDQFTTAVFASYQSDVVSVCFLSQTNVPAIGSTASPYHSAIVVVFPTGLQVPDFLGYANTVPFAAPPQTSSVPAIVKSGPLSRADLPIIKTR